MPDPAKHSKSLVIDFITVRKLLEKVVDINQPGFFRKLVIHTYDLFITPLNLMLYFIFKYFIPKPLNMSKSEMSHYLSHIKNQKVHILRIIKTWVETRKLDFVRTNHLTTTLNDFLEIIHSIEKDLELKELINDLSQAYHDLTNKIIQHK
mmetsp:Transcript_1665/g.1493  ORF Transcript_1665/g.1493 Transcript_1665/m.1493 type:complete len:150 (+) Transcript_1665:1234-1683(+)